jgi:hypothetical protein
MLEKPLPRFTLTKRLRSGAIAFYWNVPTYYRKAGCTISNEPLGTDYMVACGEDGNGGRAAALNALFDEWRDAKAGLPIESVARFGSVDWLFREYKASKAYLEKVSKRSRPDYERTMYLVTDLLTKKGDRIGARSIKAISPVSADKIYDLIIKGPKGERLRQGEKAIALCRKAWDVVHRLYPDQFDKAVPNPWNGVTLKTRVKKKKPAVDREQVYKFAWGCIERDEPAIAAAAVICFEWLQRPENVLAGYLRWTDYRSGKFPNAIKIEHHKTGETIWHPLEETATDGERVMFYEEAEAVLAKLPRLGIPMILRQPKKGPAKLYSLGGIHKLVRRMRKKVGLPAIFTLDACRHGGMTELEEAELTDGQGRALSAHRSQQSYEGYAKRTMERALSATRKRHAHRLTNTTGTDVSERQRKIVSERRQNDAAKTA